MPEDQSWYCDNDWARMTAALAGRFPRADVVVLPAAPLQIPRTVNASPEQAGPPGTP